MARSVFSFRRRLYALFSPRPAHPALSLTDEQVLEHRTNLIIAQLSRRVAKLESDMIALRLQARREDRRGPL